MRGPRPVARSHTVSHSDRRQAEQQHARGEDSASPEIAQEEAPRSHRQGHERRHGAESEGHHRERAGHRAAGGDRDGEGRIDEATGKEPRRQPEDEPGAEALVVRGAGREAGQPGYAKGRLGQEPGERTREPDEKPRRDRRGHPRWSGQDRAEGARQGSQRRIGAEPPHVPGQASPSPTAGGRESTTHSHAVRTSNEACKRSRAKGGEHSARGERMTINESYPSPPLPSVGNRWRGVWESPPQVLECRRATSP